MAPERNVVERGVPGAANRRWVSVRCPSDNPKRPNTTGVDNGRNPLSRMGFSPNRLVHNMA